MPTGHREAPRCGFYTGKNTTPHTEAIDHALAQIERELGRRLPAVDRAAVVRILEELGDAWSYHDREQRYD